MCVYRCVLLCVYGYIYIYIYFVIYFFLFIRPCAQRRVAGRILHMFIDFCFPPLVSSPIDCIAPYMLIMLPEAYIMLFHIVYVVCVYIYISIQCKAYIDSTICKWHNILYIIYVYVYIYIWGCGTQPREISEATDVDERFEFRKLGMCWAKLSMPRKEKINIP